MQTSTTALDYFASVIPEGWFLDSPSVEYDDDELLVVGALASGSSLGAFREKTRDKRVEIATEAESRYGRRVSWGVRVDGATTLFTTYNAPVATRLRFPERSVLDTLVEAGVARSRSDALGWCVRAVATHQAQWLDELRAALVGVERVRADGPSVV